MINNFTANKNMWWIATDGTTVHHGSIESGQLLSTVFTISTYDTELEYQVGLGLLGITLESNETPQEPIIE
jgi:hypothetical protein